MKRRSSSAPRTQLYRTNLKVTGVLSVLPPLMEFLGGLAIAGALWYGSREIAMGRLTAGEFTSFVGALLLMYGPVKKLSRVNANLQQAVAASERIFELLDVHTEVKEAPDAQPLPPFSDAIEFRDVVFGYDDGHGRSTLKGVSFSVRAGQMVAIVGRSGAGKTTLVNLLPRFYDVTGGAIVIDGMDIRQRDARSSLRDQIGMVTQDTVLFDDTIASQHRLRRAAARRASRSKRRRARRTRTTSSPRCPRATTRRSASAGSGCRAASGSAWRSRGRCSRTRRS